MARKRRSKRLTDKDWDTWLSNVENRLRVVLIIAADKPARKRKRAKRKTKATKRKRSRQ